MPQLQHNPKIGIIADTQLVRHLISSTIQSQGYQVSLNLDPSRIEKTDFSRSDVDVWLVEIEKEDLWSQAVDHFLEQADAPVLFGEGDPPAMNSEHFPRWQRRIFSKLKNLVGDPVPENSHDKWLSQLKHDVEHLEARNRASKPAESPSDSEKNGRAPAQQVWVLGSSLGGPEAVKQFLDGLPAQLPVAFIVAQHINPGFQEVLAQVLGRHNDFNMSVARDGYALLAGDVVLAPIENEITINEEGVIRHIKRPWPPPYAPSIDQMMLNVTKNFNGGFGAILFSGMGNDGAIAGPVMKKAGGQIWVQRADTCACSSQPDSVKATGCSNMEGSPSDLANHFIGWMRKQYPETA